MQHIVLVGLNHKAAPVEVRERLAFDDEGLREALSRFGSPHTAANTCGDEGVVLATCHRLELYSVATSAEEGQDAICRLLEDCFSQDRTVFESHLYTHADGEAVTHLFSVAAGLDSMVLGEDQILGQVTDAMEIALDTGAAGKVLSVLFRRAIETGKRARTETRISQGTTSISHLAVALVRQTLGDLSDCRVLLIGAGKMASLAARALQKNGSPSLSVVNRTLERAEALARRCGGRAWSWDQLDEALVWSDVIITSTAAPHLIIHVDELRAAMARRRHRPLFLFDIAVPRDVDPRVEHLEDVHLYDIDDLEAAVQTSLTDREGEVPEVEAVVREAQEDFLAWYRSLDVVPTIVEMRKQAHATREEELERALRRVTSLTEADYQTIEAMTKRIVNKLLHHPTVCLKERASRSDGERYAAVARDMFGLDGTEGNL